MKANVIGGKRPRGRTVSQQEIARHRMRFTDVVKRHHHQAEKDHCRDGADPIPVRRHDAVFVGVARPAEQLQRAEIGGNKGQPGDPCRHFAARQEKFLARIREMLQVKSDAENKGEVNRDDEIIDRAKGNEVRRCSIGEKNGNGHRRCQRGLARGHYQGKQFTNVLWSIKFVFIFGVKRSHPDNRDLWRNDPRERSPRAARCPQKPQRLALLLHCSPSG